MRKIGSLFQRNHETDHLVRDEVVPGSEWVIAGEGVATRKYNGACCMVRRGKLWKRYDAKAFTIGRDGQRQPYNREPPSGFEPAQEADQNTGHWPGWVPIRADDPSDRWFREAFVGNEADGTYELCGPKVSGNPEGFAVHVLVPHGKQVIDAPRTFSELREFMRSFPHEGIVWHHPDGRMVKIKHSDFWR